MNGRYLPLSLLACVLLLSIGSVSPTLAQGDINVAAEVDKTTVSTDDLVALTVTVGGEFQQLGEPQLPLLDGFSVVSSSRSSQFSMVNGVAAARTAFSYRLRPTAPGSYTIGPIAIAVNGSTYHTEPINVEVTKGTMPTSTPKTGGGQTAGDLPSHPSPGGLAGKDLYVEADVVNATPYVGQQTIYRFRLYQAVNLFDQPRLEWPAFTGFWTEGLAPNNVYEQEADGRRYRVTEVRQALFSTGSGQAIIGPTTLTIPGDLFSRDTVLKSEPVRVDVQPLPGGAPDGFSGAVGRFEISSWVEPDQTRVNEPLTLFVRVQGNGNLATIPDPTEAADDLLPDWRVYDPQITTNVGQDGDIIYGEKVFERLLVPRTDGDLHLPGFGLVFFDPESAEYRRVETEPLVVRVEPGDSGAPGTPGNGTGKQDITLLGSDIRHIKAAPPSLATSRVKTMEKPAYWLAWIVPALATGGVWVWDRRRRRLSSDTAYARAQQAQRLSRRRLAQARKLARKDEEPACAAVARALTGYLADKLNLPAAGLTRDEVQRVLAGRAVSQDLIDRTLSCLDWADSGRFAPVAAGRHTENLIDETEAVIEELEKTLPKGKSHKA